jgi:hypothetical protein
MRALPAPGEIGIEHIGLRNMVDSEQGDTMVHAASARSCPAHFRSGACVDGLITG